MEERAQPFPIVAEIDVAENVHRVFDRRLRTKKEPRRIDLHGAAEVDLFAGDRRIGQFGKELRDGELRRSVQHEPERGIGDAIGHEDRRAVEVRIGQAGSCADDDGRARGRRIRAGRGCRHGDDGQQNEERAKHGNDSAFGG